MAKAFTLKQHFIDAAKKTFDKILGDFKKKRKKGKSKKKMKSDLTVVGIHSRRTDHLAFEAEKNYVPLKPSYFLKAMDIFREHFKNVVFLYISDDFKWGKENLQKRNKMGDLYFAGSQKEGINGYYRK